MIYLNGDVSIAGMGCKILTRQYFNRFKSVTRCLGICRFFSKNSPIYSICTTRKGYKEPMLTLVITGTFLSNTKIQIKRKEKELNKYLWIIFQFLDN